MDLHERFAHVHRFPGPADMHPVEYYMKCLVSSLYEVGRVSNTPRPIPLPSWDDDADLENIIAALNTLKQDITEMLEDHRPKTLQDVLSTIGVEGFNHLVMTFLSGDEEYIHDSLTEGEEITPSPYNYMKKLCEAGYKEETFPWNELRTYSEDLDTHLEYNLIIEIP